MTQDIAKRPAHHPHKRSLGKEIREYRQMYQFVVEWYEKGGEIITEEANERYHSR